MHLMQIFIGRLMRRRHPLTSSFPPPPAQDVSPSHPEHHRWCVVSPPSPDKCDNSPVAIDPVFTHFFCHQPGFDSLIRRLCKSILSSSHPMTHCHPRGDTRNPAQNDSGSAATRSLGSRRRTAQNITAKTEGRRRVTF